MNKISIKVISNADIASVFGGRGDSNECNVIDDQSVSVLDAVLRKSDELFLYLDSKSDFPPPPKIPVLKPIIETKKLKK